MLLIAAVVICLSAIPSAPARGQPCCWIPKDISLSLVTPPPREKTAMAHLPGVGPVGAATVLFGGLDENGVALNDTWRYDCVNNVWSELQFGPCGCGVNSFKPCARYGHAMARSPNAGRIVLFGGRDPDGSLTDGNTYEIYYDAVAEAWVWQCLMISGPAPAPRAGHKMAFDDSQGVIVLFGGETAADTYSDETWVFNGASWTLKDPSLRPPARADHAMAFDGVANLTVVYGGTALAGDLGDVWRYDLNTGGPQGSWSQCAEGPVGPGARHGHEMVFDPTSGRITMLGGLEAGGPSSAIGDTWHLSGCNWTENICLYVAAPPTRRHFGMAYDTSCLQVIVFGGRRNIPVDPELLRDTWGLVCELTIGDQPDSLVVRPGEDATFTVTVTDFPEFQVEYDYQWRKNGVPITNDPPRITGADTDALTIRDCRPEDDGAYDVKVVRHIQLDAPPVTSNPAALSVVPDPADVNGDGVVNGEDIQPFLSALLIP